MAKLEAQISQIYLIHPEAKSNVIVLHDEKLSNSAQLFLLAEIKSGKHRSQSADLKKIAEIIISTFKANKKLPRESLFESSLAEINENLADLAHKGHKDWLNKFSAGILLAQNGSLYAANSGLVEVTLFRKNDLLEILQADKVQSHPLKIFQNFSVGRLKENDIAILAATNLFNYVSKELFFKILNLHGSEETARNISNILKDSNSDEGFSCFLLKFAGSAEPVPLIMPQTAIYAPLPEDDLVPQTRQLSFFPKAVFPLSNLRHSSREWFRQHVSHVRLFSKIRPKNWNTLSPARKFFLASFLVFILLFSINVVVFGFKLAGRKNTAKVEAGITNLLSTLHEAEAASIYKDGASAQQLLSKARAEFIELNKLKASKAEEFSSVLDDLYKRINKITSIESPRPEAELKFSATMLVRAGSGFLLADQDSKNLSFYQNGSLTYFFLLNNPKDAVTGMTHVPAFGHVVAMGNRLYRINEGAKQLDLIKNLPNPTTGLKFASQRLLAADRNAGQILRLNFSAGKFSDPQILLKADLSGLADFAADANLYLLFGNTVKKYANGIEQSFTLSPLFDPLTAANKLIVVSNIYVLEGTKKRLLIFNKQGVLQSQLIFPNTQALTDFYVDESSRTIFLLDGNKLLSVTF